MMAIEFHQIKRKWLLLGSYKPPIQSDTEFTAEITWTLSHYIPSCNILLLGDFNMTSENFYCNSLMQNVNLNVLIKISLQIFWINLHHLDITVKLL